jgi:hypothetical protein
MVVLIWRVMSGNGVLTGIMISIMQIVLAKILRGLPVVSTGSYAAVAGTTTPGTVGLPFATSTFPASASSSSAFAFFRSCNYFLQTFLSKSFKSFTKEISYLVYNEERTESFNDSLMSNFLADKEILRWDSHFFERKNEYFWTVLVEYRPSTISQTEPFKKTEKGRDESYKELLTENDWPLFNVLREWQASEDQSQNSTERRSYA